MSENAPTAQSERPDERNRETRAPEQIARRATLPRCAREETARVVFAGPGQPLMAFDGRSR